MCCMVKTLLRDHLKGSGIFEPGLLKLKLMAFLCSASHLLLWLPLEVSGPFVPHSVS